MTRSSPDPSNESLPVRWGLRLLAALASMKLAVVLIAVLIVVLAWATIVDSVYGAAAASFGFYGSWWFLVLCVLLGLNVLAAVVARFPWTGKGGQPPFVRNTLRAVPANGDYPRLPGIPRRQLGFLLTHVGILVLMAGALVGNFMGTRMQLKVFEGTSSRRAEKTTQHFAIEIGPTPADRAASDATAETFDVAFRPGPFNWDDYDELSWFPWRLIPRSRGAVFDRRGVALDVLDYYADSQLVAVPRISLRVDWGGRPASGRSDVAGSTPMTLAVDADTSPGAGAARSAWASSRRRRRAIALSSG